MKFKFLIFLFVLIQAAQIGAQNKTIEFEGKLHKIYPLTTQNYFDNREEDFFSDQFNIIGLETRVEDGNYVLLNNTELFGNIKDSNINSSAINATFAVKNGKINGLTKFYSMKTNESEQRKVVYSCYYTNNLKEGKATFYRYNEYGFLNDSSTAFFRNGILSGPFKRIGILGNPIEEGNLKDNLKTGQWINYMADGIRIEEFDSPYLLLDSMFKKDSALASDTLYERRSFNMVDFNLYSVTHRRYNHSSISREIVTIYRKKDNSKALEIISDFRSKSYKKNYLYEIYPCLPPTFLPIWSEFENVIFRYVKEYSKIIIYKENNKLSETIDLSQMRISPTKFDFKTTVSEFNRFYFPSYNMPFPAEDSVICSIKIDSFVNYKKVNFKAIHNTLLCFENTNIIYFDRNYLDKEIYYYSDSTHQNSIGEKLNYHCFSDCFEQYLQNPDSHIFYSSQISKKDGRLDTIKLLHFVNEIQNGLLSDPIYTMSDLNSLKQIGIDTSYVINDNELIINKFVQSLNLSDFKNGIGFVKRDELEFSKIIETNNNIRQNESLNEYANKYYFDNHIIGKIPTQTEDQLMPTKFYMYNLPLAGIVHFSFDSFSVDSFCKVEKQNKMNHYYFGISHQNLSNFIYQFRLTEQEKRENRKFQIILPFKNGYLEGTISVIGEKDTMMSYELIGGKLNGKFKRIEKFSPQQYESNLRMLSMMFNVDNDTLTDKLKESEIKYIIQKMTSRIFSNTTKEIYESQYKVGIKDGNFLKIEESDNGLDTVYNVFYNNGELDGICRLEGLKAKLKNGIPEHFIFEFNRDSTKHKIELNNTESGIEGYLPFGALNSQNKFQDSVYVKNGKIQNKFIFRHNKNGELIEKIETKLLEYPSIFRFIEKPDENELSFGVQGIKLGHYSDFINPIQLDEVFSPIFTLYKDNYVLHEYYSDIDEWMASYPGIHTLFSNGKTSAVGQMNELSGLTGKWEYFYQSGKKYCEINFPVDGFLNKSIYSLFRIKITITYYDTSGAPYCKANLINWEYEKDCENVTFLPIGEIDDIEMLGKYRNTKQFRLFHQNGVKYLEGAVELGQKNGIWKRFNKSGLPIEIGRFDKGNKEGRWVSGDLSLFPNLDEICASTNQLNLSNFRINLEVRIYKRNIKVDDAHFYGQKSDQIGSIVSSSSVLDDFTGDTVLMQILLKIMSLPKSNSNRIFELINTKEQLIQQRKWSPSEAFKNTYEYFPPAFKWKIQSG